MVLFQIIERINDVGEYGVSDTFNVLNLTLFDVGDDLRSDPFEERRDDAMQAPKDPLKVSVGLVTRLRAKRFKEAFNGVLQDTWTKVDFKRILNSKEQAIINLIHVQEGLLVEPRPLHKDWEKKTRFGQFDLRYLVLS